MIYIDYSLAGDFNNDFSSDFADGPNKLLRIPKTKNNSTQCQ